MEVSQLRAFVAIAETGHLGRAAIQLHLTQSAVSKQLKALEDTAGYSLFLRTSAGMILTSRGKEFLPFATTALEAFSSARAALTSYVEDITGHIELGTIVDPESLKLGQLLNAITRSFPGLSIRLVQGTSGEGLAGLKAKKLDVAFYLGELADPSIMAIRLSSERYVIAIPTAFTADVANCTLAEILSLPWIGAGKGSSQRALIDQLFNPRGVKPKVVAEADQEAQMINLARAGVGVCLVRSRLAESLAAERAFWFYNEVELASPLSVLIRAEDTRKPQTKAFVRELANIWQLDSYK